MSSKVKRTSKNKSRLKKNGPFKTPPTTTKSPPTCSITSFDSDIENELMIFMDQLDCGIISSTPSNSKNSISLFNFSPTPVTSDANYKLTTPSSLLTSPQFRISKMESPSVLETPLNKSRLSLSHWGLPPLVVNQYALRGINEMFEWQAECLSLHGVLLGRSIIYSAPTSAGKTLVAELLSLKCILEHRKKVVMVLPFVSIVHEKTNYFRGMFEEVGVKIGGFAGNQSPQGGLSGVDMAICTIEKANSLINHTLEENKLDQIGMIVIDELHMIGDNNRGYLIELLLTKLRHVCKIKNDDNNGGLQLVGMSATLPNLNTLGRWLDALVYTTDYRPVPLKEMVKIGNSLYDDKFVILSELQNCTNDEDYLHKACSDKISKGQSVLIFCPTKIWCEKLSCAIAKIFSNSPELFLDSQAGLNSLCEQLRRTQVGLDPTLAKVIPMGIAYHHAGLTFDEREIIEGGFRHSLIRVLIATSTLSSGVNLPARLVIIRTPTFNQSIMDPFVYRQMIGRAGRKGIDEEGESVLMCKPSERAKVVSLLNSAPKDVKSCLYNFTLSGSCTDTKALNRAILEVVVNNAVSLHKDIVLYISCTLLGTQLADSVTDTKDVEEKINFLSETSLNFLLEHNFVLKRKEDSNKLLEEYCATQLGMATVSSFLSPNEALIILDEFMKARKSLVLENELHLIYLVTPVSVVNQWPCIDWYNYLCIWERLTPDMKHVADVVGVEQSFIVRAVQRKPLEKTEIQKRKLLIHKRFYTSLTLNDLIKELPVNAVAKQYGASKGLLQSLQSAAGSFAGMVTVFCNRLGWKNMELLLAQFHTRLIFGIEKELCDLVKISLLNGCRARVLYNSGYHTLFALASANPSAIEFTLRKAFPFNNNKGDAATVNWCSHLRKGLTEVDAAILIVQEAQLMLCQEMNIPLAAWKKIHSIPDFSKIDENRIIEVKPPKLTTPTTVEQLRYSRKQTIASHHTLKVNDIYPKRLKLEDNAGDISDHLIAPNTSVDLFTDDSGVMNAMETSNQVDDEKDKYLDDDVISMFFSDTLNDCSVICLDNDAATNLFTCPDSGLSVIDLSIDSKSLQAFIDQCTGGNINLLSFSVAIENVYTNDCIGASVIKPISKVKGLPVPMSNKQVMGVAFYCGDGMQVYYLPLNQCSNKEVSKEETDACPVVSLSTRLEAISSLLSTLTKLTAVNFKQQIKYLISLCHDVKACSPCDPHVANWLIDPDADQKTLQDLVTIHLPDQPVIRKDDDGDNLPLSSIIDHPAFSSHLRAAAESIISFALMKKLEPLLCTENLLQAFCTSEMQMIIILAKMETNGIGFALEQCNKIRDDLKLHLTKLEQDAYKLAKRKFALSSPIEVGKVLFQELKLPSFQTDRKIDAKKLKNHQLQRLSTSKEILQKLATLHPLPGTILEWRRVNNTLTRTIYPLYKHAMTHSQLDGCVRIHTTYEFHTSTGRIITSNPNIQTVPKDYSLYVYEGNNDNPTIKNDDKSYILQQSQEVVSMRNVFTSFPNGVFVSADYSQLELRVLAHLSNDEKLCLILNEEGDAFRSIAAEWKGVQPSQITEQERQQTKQMCYGMIYGIGAQSLSEQLGVDQNSAINFLESFKSRYSGMSNFIKETVQNCQLNGHIKTLLNRKRHLPAIHSSDGALRSQAQRQAINSTVQGSAADIVKKAMIDIDNALRGSGLITCLSQSSDKVETGKFALLVLQLHDELIYEVHESKLQKVAEIVRNGMENVMALKVKLPVKLHTGKSWGQLQPYL